METPSLLCWTKIDAKAKPPQAQNLRRKWLKHFHGAWIATIQTQNLKGYTIALDRDKEAPKSKKTV